MCICLSVAVNVGGVLEVRVCLRTDNCHSHFGKIKIMRCLCVCPEKKKQKLAAVAPMCHPHQILFEIRFSNLEIKRGALDLWYLFIFDIFPRSLQDDILDVRKMFKQNDLSKVRSFLKQCLHDLHFMKTRSFLPNLSNLAPSDIS